MRWKDVVIGTVVGFACGYATKYMVDKYTNQSPDTILSQVKETLKADGKIIGSWILMTPEKFHKNGLEYEVFKGGLTKIANEKQRQLHFVADASTGTILEVSEQTN